MLISSSDTTLRLVADVGGTNARFGLLRGARGAPEFERTLPTADYPGIDAAIEDYLRQVDAGRPVEAAVAIANPVTGDTIKMSNCPWTFSIQAMRTRLGLERLLVLNDFTALAMSLPVIPGGQLQQLGGGTPVQGTPLALIGPGTGLGVSALIPVEGGWIPLSSEGGHVSVSCSCAREASIVDMVRHTWPHVSAERLLSGMGLVNLYQAIARLARAEPEQLTAVQVGERGMAGGDAFCGEALEVFCAMLGAAAGNLVLTLGARGGLYIGGGIVPRLGEYFAGSQFRHCFEDKGRLSPYVAGVPAYLIRAVNPALLGAAMALGVVPEHADG